MSEYSLSIEKILEFLPHRPPFLLIDRVVSIEVPEKQPVGIQVTALKSVTMSEPWFVGHFPGRPIMPGVLILEAMAQTAGFSVYPRSVKENGLEAKTRLMTLAAVDAVRFRRPVVPGDRLRIVTTVTKARGHTWKVEAKAWVEDDLCAEAEILAQIVEKD